MKGRKPIPDEIKKKAGTLRPVRINKKKPDFLPGAPAMPEWLPESAKGFFLEFGNMLFQAKVITPADAPALIMMSTAWSEWKDNYQLCLEEGRTYIAINIKGEQLERVNPKYSLAERAFDRLMRLLIEFGMTPSSRSRVKTVDDLPSDPFELLQNE